MSHHVKHATRHGKFFPSGVEGHIHFPALLLAILFLWLIASCGFQLNRNRYRLPGDATSISIMEVVNLSYTPGLDLELRDLLVNEMAKNSIPITSPNLADLTLSVHLQSAIVKREGFSLDGGNSGTYTFTFIVSGTFRVKNNKTRTTPTKRQSVSGVYSTQKKVDDPDLSPGEIRHGRHQALRNLSEVVTSKLTQSF